MCYANKIDPKDLPVTAVNPKERAILGLLLANDCREGVHISQLNTAAWASKGGPTTSDPTSWTRNSLRRPVRAGYVRPLGRGRYRLTPRGRTVARKL